MLPWIETSHPMSCLPRKPADKEWQQYRFILPCRSFMAGSFNRRNNKCQGECHEGQNRIGRAHRVTGLSGDWYAQLH
jgi:hypothetical protein